MPYYTSTRTSTQFSYTKECAPSPCPACGGLQCLCRPRFFAGQLLTEEDLNRLENYIIEKNKLHNRYLQGWGVVCGLEVVCNPCPGEVTIKSGYALSPCGEDIVVCQDDTVNVCDLIKKCRDKQRRQWECEPPGYATASDCQDVTEDWILAIRYDEKPSRGITALRASTASPCCSRCSCGGSSACGCACHEQTNGAMKNGSKSSQKAVSTQCEPTIICEGYVYEVYKAPTATLYNGRNVDQGPLVAHFEQCIKCFLAAIPQPPDTTNATTQQMYQWCCSLKASLLDFLSTNDIYDCQVAERLAAYTCPDPAQIPTPQLYLTEVESQLGPLWFEQIFYCFCSTLLPPCPGPVDDPRVPLATITVRKDSCQILQVCDWNARKIAITLPSLEYWLSILPYGRQLLECLKQLCCRPFEAGEFTAGATKLAGFATLGNIFAPLQPTNDFSPFLFELLAYLARCVFANRLSTHASNTMATFMLGKGPGGTTASDILATFLANREAATATPAAESRDAEINSLKTQLAELQKTMQAHQARIEELNPPLKRRK
jgi:hypothetical protein